MDIWSWGKKQIFLDFTSTDTHCTNTKITTNKTLNGPINPRCHKPTEINLSLIPSLVSYAEKVQGFATKRSNISILTRADENVFAIAFYVHEKFNPSFIYYLCFQCHKHNKNELFGFIFVSLIISVNHGQTT